MKYNYLLMCLIVSMVNINIFGTDFASDQMADESPVEQDSLLNKGSSGRVMACSCEQCVQQSRVVFHEKELMINNGYASPYKFLWPQLNLFEVAHKILDDVLRLGLKTANSIASNSEDHRALHFLRANSPVPICIDESNNKTYFLDEMFCRAKLSIQNNVANCLEYAILASIFSLEWCSNYPRQIMFKFISGNNFDHDFIAIGQPGHDSSTWIAIDPWLRKVFPFDKAIDHLKEAGVKPNLGSEYSYDIFNILDENYTWDPIKYNLRNIKKLTKKNSQRGLISIGTSGYQVPYESQYKSYDSGTQVMTIGSKIRVRIIKKT